LSSRFTIYAHHRSFSGDPCCSCSKHAIHTHIYRYSYTCIYIIIPDIYIYIGTSHTRILCTAGYRGRGKRIKNIEHVLPGINNIQKAKRRGREKFARANLMRGLDRSVSAEFAHCTGSSSRDILYTHPVCIYIYIYMYGGGVLYIIMCSLLILSRVRSVRASERPLYYITYIRARRLYTYLQRAAAAAAS